jgi:sulfur dioxygenase
VSIERMNAGESLHSGCRRGNVLEGFEGDLDERGQRGHRGGWRRHGLPWQQT